MWRRGRWFLMLGAAIAALELVASTACMGPAAPDPGSSLRALTPGFRPVEARPSFPLAWAALAPEADTPGPVEERERAYAELLQAKVDGVPGGFRGLAVFYAARDEEGDAARALALLGLRAGGAPTEPIEPALEIDRGVVLLAVGRLDEAYERFAAAAEAAPTNAVARFDAAVALQALDLDGHAIAAFEAALALEPAGAWAEEARLRLTALRDRPLGPSPDMRKVETVAALLDAGGPAALAAARPLAEELAAIGDRLLVRELAYLESLEAEGWARRRREVAAYREARASVLAGRNADAALERLSRNPEPLLAVKADQFAIYAAISRGDRARAAGLVDGLIARCERLGCVEEAALAEGDRGTLLHWEADFQGAREVFARAERSLPEAFLARRAELLAKTAAVARDTGALREAARGFDVAARLQRATGVQALATTLSLHAGVLSNLGLRRAAEATLREAIEATRANPDVRAEARPMTRLAEVIGASPRRRPEALALLEALTDRLRGSELASFRRPVLAARARLLLADGQAHAALPLAREAAALGRTAGSADAAWATALLEADALREAGDPRAAEEVLRELPDPGTRSPRPLEALRRRALAAGRWHRLALLRAEAGDAEGAVRALLADVAPGRPPPGECRQLAARVADRIVAASLTADGARAIARPADGDGPVAALGCPDQARRAWIELPGSLPSATVAWADDAASGTWTAVVRGPAPLWPGPWSGGRALAVIDPVVAPEEGLAALPGASREAEAIAGALGPAQVLSGAAATPEAFRVAAPSADLLHLAVHGISPRGAGPASYLALAGERGRLQVADVLALDLRRRRPIVVLTACGSAGGAEDGEEADGGGLPWAFLTAGARAVVAHEGALDDEASVTFSRAFYGELGRGEPVAGAVAAARVAVAAAHGPEAARSFLLYLPGRDT